MMEKTPDSVMRFRRRGEIMWIPEKARGSGPSRKTLGVNESEEKADSSLRSE